MKPSFALNFSHDGISLLHRTQRGWLLVGAASVEDPSLSDTLGYLRGTALGLEPGGITSKLIIPASQILYLDLEAPGPELPDRLAQIRQGLDGRTPYAVEDLVFDWSGTGSLVQVAVVARETLEEAEAFAREHRFNPVCFVAIPEQGSFEGEPFFGLALHPDSAQSSEDPLERDAEPVSAPGLTDTKRKLEPASEREPGALSPDVSPAAANSVTDPLILVHDEAESQPDQQPVAQPQSVPVPVVPAVEEPPVTTVADIARAEAEMAARRLQLEESLKARPEPAQTPPAIDVPAAAEPEQPLPPPVVDIAPSAPVAQISVPDLTDTANAEADAPKTPMSDPAPEPVSAPAAAPAETAAASGSMFSRLSRRKARQSEAAKAAAGRTQPNGGGSADDPDAAFGAPASPAPLTDVPEAPSMFDVPLDDIDDPIPPALAPPLAAAFASRRANSGEGKSASRVGSVAARLAIADVTDQASEAMPKPGGVRGSGSVVTAPGLPPNGLPTPPAVQAPLAQGRTSSTRVPDPRTKLSASPKSGTSSPPMARFVPVKPKPGSKLVAPVPQPTTARPVTARAEGEAMTVFGARKKPAVQRGKPRYLGLMLVVVLLLLLVAVAIWSTFFLASNTTTRLFAPRETSVAALDPSQPTAELPASSPEIVAAPVALAPALETVPEELAADEPVVEDLVVADPVVADPVVEEAVAANPTPVEPIADAATLPEPFAAETVAPAPAVETAIVDEPAEIPPLDPSVTEATPAAGVPALAETDADAESSLTEDPVAVAAPVALEAPALIAESAPAAIADPKPGFAAAVPEVPDTTSIAIVSVENPAESPESLAPVASVSTSSAPADAAFAAVEALAAEDQGPPVAVEPAPEVQSADIAAGLSDVFGPPTVVQAADGAAGADTTEAPPSAAVLVPTALAAVIEDARPQTPLPPAPAGTFFVRDANGLIVATPDGAPTPEGALVFAGRPPLVPPSRPASLTPAPADPLSAEALPPVPAEALFADPKLAGFRPRQRPADLVGSISGVDQPEPQIDGAVAAEPPLAFASARPRPRPAALEAAAKEALELAAASTSGRVSSPRPAARPRDFSPSIEAALAEAAAPEPTPLPATEVVLASSQPTAQPTPKPQPKPVVEPEPEPKPVAKPKQKAAAPAPQEDTAEADEEPEVASAAPAIPTKASVAKQATFANAINLSKINLIGVFGPTSDRSAMVRLSSGRIIKVKVGDRVDGGKVSAIGSGELRYVKNGRDVVLSMLKNS